jgi:hypothetical protein
VKVSHLVASLPTGRQQVVFELLVPSCQQVWNELLKTCNKLLDIIRLIARLFQQVRHSHDIAILVQPCVVNLVTFCYIMTVSDLLEQPCNKSDNATLSLLQVVNSLFQFLLQQLGTSSATTTCRHLVNRFVTTCLQTCNNLYVFTCVIQNL